MLADRREMSEGESLPARDHCWRASRKQRLQRGRRERERWREGEGTQILCAYHHYYYLRSCLSCCTISLSSVHVNSSPSQTPPSITSSSIPRHLSLAPTSGSITIGNTPSNQNLVCVYVGMTHTSCDHHLYIM